MTDNNANEMTAQPERQRWRVLVWVLLGALCGAGLVVLFIAYGQPAMLLEQMNLRYCG